MNLLRVAVIMDGRVEYEREVLRGIREYSTTGGEWLIRLEPPGDDTAEFLRQWKPDGILFQSAGLESDALEAVKHYGKRAIHVSDAIDVRGRSSFVGMDNSEIGYMAADHFIELGRENFAFIGVRDAGFSERRGIAFSSRIANHGRGSQSYFLDDWNLRRHEEAHVLQFLENLSRPCSLFTTHDECALWISTLCRSAGIRIPEDVAVLGVDNDELICELAWPTISSIAVPSRRVGYEASLLLDEVLRGTRTKSGSKLLLPDRVVTRDSTHSLETSDEAVNRAIRFIREHLSTPINVSDVARGAGVSRRLLERKFREVANCSPLNEIQKQRIDRAKELLIDPDNALSSIADQCGCTDASQLIVRFRRATGMTPGAYRQSIPRD